MRLKDEYRQVISSTFKELFPEHKLYLFGSRTDDSKKGGDIDLLILGETKLNLNEIGKFRIELWKQLEEQKIDIVSFTNEEKSTFKELIFEEKIEI
ncbi:MAG: polymerase subunit beta [Ignavibacteria bacterium]|nr:polymerase subunit beta [Ignavibacteria bacterium]